tara:strand:- start:453 stop:617 length:165 start_codon:yes stop_codon:yes gene_type:complete
MATDVGVLGVEKHGVNIEKKIDRQNERELNVILLWWNMMHLLEDKYLGPEGNEY